MGKRYYAFYVIFERKFKIGVVEEEEKDYKVWSIKVEVRAENVDEAIKLAWQSVTVSPNDYRINSVIDAHSHFDRLV